MAIVAWALMIVYGAEIVVAICDYAYWKLVVYQHSRFKVIVLMLCGEGQF